MRALSLAVALVAAPALAQADPVQHLADALALTPDQADLVAEVYDPRDPASLWTLTAELWPTLAAPQREALLSPPDRAGARPPEGRRAGAEGRGARRRPDPAQEAVARAARDAALGLDADQAAALDAALDHLRDARATRDPGDVPDAIAAVLTPDQIDLYRAHRALQLHLRRARAAVRR